MFVRWFFWGAGLQHDHCARCMNTRSVSSSSRPAVCPPCAIDDELCDMIEENEDTEAAPLSVTHGGGACLPPADPDAEPGFAARSTRRQIATPCRGFETGDKQRVVSVHSDARPAVSNMDQKEAAPLLQTKKRLRSKTSSSVTDCMYPRRLQEAAPAENSCVFDWKTRQRAEQLYAAHWMKIEPQTDESFWERRAAGRCVFRKFPPEAQRPWLLLAVKRSLQEDSVDSSPSGTGEAAPPVPLAMRQLPPEARAVGCLLTWNGNWCADCPEVVAAFAEERDSVERLSLRVSQAQSCRTLMRLFWEAMERQCQAMGFLHCSCAVEISLHSEVAVRVHLHAFMSLPASARGVRPLRIWQFVRFGNRRAGHAAPCLPGKGAQSRPRAVGRGHYYLQVPKSGSVLRQSNYVKNEGFLVSAKWIMDLWRQRKLTHDRAKAELLESRDKSTFHSQEIDRQQRAEYAQVQQAASEKVLRDLSWARPWRPATAEEIVWLSQFLQTEAAPVCVANNVALEDTSPSADALSSLPLKSAPLRRYKVLVYDGPSRTGKSERARHWFGSERTLVLQCQGIVHPCLIEWLEGKHCAILYEEATWELLWHNRLLMQSGPQMVQLGQSPTNQSMYSVNVFRCPMMLVSNNFWAGCDDAEARSWILENTVYRYITEPQWL